MELSTYAFCGRGATEAVVLQSTLAVVQQSPFSWNEDSVRTRMGGEPLAYDERDAGIVRGKRFVTIIIIHLPLSS